MPAVALTMGNVHYEKVGPDDGRPVVLIHGYAMGRSLWRPLTERLATRGLQCIAPTWPLGAHTEPMDKRAQLTIEAIAAVVGELLEELSLEDVVLVGNDTGGAIAQVGATAAAHQTRPPARVRRARARRHRRSRHGVARAGALELQSAGRPATADRVAEPADDGAGRGASARLREADADRVVAGRRVLPARGRPATRRHAAQSTARGDPRGENVLDDRPTR